MPDVAVVGAGIVGCALAAFLAEAGASVLVVERDGVAAAASGRNSGVVQHPMDAALAPLFEESLRHYRGLGVLPDEPRGILMLSPSGVPDELEPLRAAFPELRPEPLAAGEPARLEPALAPDLAGLRLDTGYPIGPTTATNAFADRARAAGASIVTGAAAALAPGGLMVAGERRPAGAVVVAAGPWTSALVDPGGDWRPIVPLWGVVAEVQLDAPPCHTLEEAGIDELVASGSPPPLFSLVTLGAACALGSTFLPDRPDPAALRAAPARARRALRAGAVQRPDRRRPGLRQAAVRRRAAAARPRARPRRRVRGRRSRTLGDLARPGVGPARRRPRARARRRAAAGIRSRPVRARVRH